MVRCSDHAACRCCPPASYGGGRHGPLWEDRRVSGPYMGHSRTPHDHRVPRSTHLHNVAPTRSVPMSSNPVAVTVASLMPRAKEELTELVAFKSVADFDQFPREESEGAARWIADALTAEGFQDVALLDTPDGTQSVYGYLPGPEGAKTVLLYAHYDVQPPLDEAGLDHAAVRADRAGRPLVRARRRRLQGRRHHAPARAARPEGERRRAGQRQDHRGGLGGAGHGRPGAVRRGAPGPAHRRHDRHRRRGQLPRQACRPSPPHCAV